MSADTLATVQAAYREGKATYERGEPIERIRWPREHYGYGFALDGYRAARRERSNAS